MPHKFIFLQMTTRLSIILWIIIKLGISWCYIGALYHPSKAAYDNREILTQLELYLDNINNDACGSVMLILAGDFNQLSNSDILSLGLSDCVYTPTHRGHNLDRVYCSGITYKHFKIVTSTVKTEHRAIVARSDDTVIADCNKVNRKLSIRKRSPQQHASFLFFMRNYSWQAILLSLNVQLATNDSTLFCNICKIDSTRCQV